MGNPRLNIFANALFAVVVLIWLGAVTFLDSLFLSGSYRQIRAAYFPTATGRITRSEVSGSASDRHPKYDVAIEYDYVVNGEKFHGNRSRYSTQKSPDHAWAEEAVHAHPVGATVTVYYRSGDPKDAILSPGLDGGDLFMFFLATLVDLLLLRLLASVWNDLRFGVKSPPAGGAKIFAGQMRLRVRFPGITPLAAGLIAVAGSCFAAIFIIGFTTLFHPSLMTAEITWAIILAGGVAIYFWRWSRLRSGAEDLVLDEDARTMILPRTFDRKQAVSLAWADIAAVEVNPREYRDRRGNTYTLYQVNLALKQYLNMPTTLAEWRDESAAESFATWLREKLQLHDKPVHRGPHS